LDLIPIPNQGEKRGKEKKRKGEREKEMGLNDK